MGSRARSHRLRKALIAAGANLEIRNQDNETAPASASRYNKRRRASAELLVEYGADLSSISHLKNINELRSSLEAIKIKKDVRKRSLNGRESGRGL